MLPTVDEIIHIFQEGDQDQRLSFVDTCSCGKYRAQARQVLELDSSREAGFQSLDFLARGCLESGHYKLAERISESYYLLARTYLDLNMGDAFRLRFYAGRGAVNWMSALKEQGDFKQVNNLIDEAINWLETCGDADHFELLRLKKVESFLDLEEFHKAQRAFREISESRLSATNLVFFSALEYRIRMRKGGKKQLPIDFIEPAGERQTDMRAIPAQEESVVRQKITEASYLLTDPRKGSDAVEIAKVEPELIAGRDWMRDHHYSRAENDACWSLYLAYNRTHRYELAVEQLQRIRSNMEDARSRMTDPPGRARLVERFPYLYPCLCTLYFQLGRYEDLLEAIEASKCRIRADLVTKESGEPATERDFSSDLHELGPLLSRLNSHYYSCFVDDDCVYGVLLSSRGVVKAARIPINRERIEYYASISNPEVWGQPDPIDPVRRRIPEDLTQKLSLFVKVLKTALEQHELQEGDHICYSAHDALLDIPFHYMDVNGSPLVDYFSLSHIPDVHALVKVLKKEAYIARKYTYIDVPSLQDMDGKEGSIAPGESGRWLANHLSDGRHLLGEEANRETLVQEELGESILHFSTHGSTPGEKNPGILLAANQKLPDIALISRGGAEEHLLSAQVLFRLEAEMNKSHITLQAWVPNSVKKGTKTDPPGLIWVFLHKGAASMLTANWQVPSRTAALFINTFYKYWLELGYSRSKAWRATVLELKNTDQSSHPHQWAAFSLSGDWR